MRLFRYISIFLAIAILCMPAVSHAQALSADQKAQLQQELAQVEAEQKQAQADLESAKAQSSSLSRDIAVLDAKIKAAQLDIKAKNLLIQTLGNDITSKQKHINNLEDRIDTGKQTLAQVLRKTNEIGDASIPELLLSQSSVTGFFKDVDTFQAVQDGLKSTFEQLRSDEETTSAEKGALEVRLNTETDARHAIQVQQANIKADQTEKNRLLSTSKGNEKAYSSVVAQKQARASQIRAALFALAGGSNGIPFGDALKYAQAASQRTGVRPAFLLAILTQESALGKNVGSCYLTNTTTGSGVNAKTGNPVSNVMKPSRDVTPFITIVTALGGDPMKQVVSCPQSVGYGGAMGPAQFIASTWMLFKDRIAAEVGISGMPDPWNPSHAFMASATYLSDLGAGAGTYSAERNAACKYYSGSSCSKSSLIASYGNSVTAKADNIQRTMIDPLAGL